MPPETPGASCLLLYGYGDCRESNYCNGIGTCVDGQCVCPPGFFDTNCSLFVECKYWDPPTGNWSIEGVTSSNPEPNTVVCTTNHLTDFGGVALFVPPPTPNATPYNYSIIPPVDPIVPAAPLEPTPAAVLVLSVAAGLFVLDAFILAYMRWRKRRNARRKLKEKLKVSPEPKGRMRDRIIGGFSASDLPVYPLPISEFEPPTTFSARGWFVARAEHTIYRISKPLPPSVPNMLTRPEAIQLAFVSATTALCAAVGTLVLRQISLSSEDRLLVMTQSDGLVIATYTAALASVVGYLFSYVLASVFRQQRWARLPKMPKAPLKANGQKPRKPMEPRPPKTYHEYTGDTILMDDEPTPEQAAQFAAMDGRYAPGEDGASDDDGGRADSQWRAPQKPGYDGGSEEEEVEETPAQRRQRKVQELLERSATASGPGPSKMLTDMGVANATNRLVAPPQAPGQLEQWHTSRGWLRQLSNLGSGATIGGTFANINQSLFGADDGGNAESVSGLPQIGTVLGAGGKSAAQTTLGALRSGAGASSDEEGVGMTRQRSMITFGGAQQLVKPAASNALTDASGAPQLEQWQTSRNWLRTLPALGSGMTIGSIGKAAVNAGQIVDEADRSAADAMRAAALTGGGGASAEDVTTIFEEGGNGDGGSGADGGAGATDDDDGDPEGAAARAAVPADVPPIGTLEYADYLDSLEKRKRKLSEKLQKTESGRLYLSAADREAADAEIAAMNEQLAADDLLAANIKRANQRVEEQAEAALETMDEEQQAEVALRWEKAHGLQHVPGFRRDRSRLQLQKEAADARKAAKEEKERKAAEEEAAEARAMRAAKEARKPAEEESAPAEGEEAEPSYETADHQQQPIGLETMISFGGKLQAEAGAPSSSSALAPLRLDLASSPAAAAAGEAGAPSTASPRDGGGSKPLSARGLKTSSSLAALPGRLGGAAGGFDLAPTAAVDAGGPMMLQARMLGGGRPATAGGVPSGGVSRFGKQLALQNASSADESSALSGSSNVTRRPSTAIGMRASAARDGGSSSALSDSDLDGGDGTSGAARARRRPSGAWETAPISAPRGVGGAEDDDEDDDEEEVAVDGVDDEGVGAVLVSPPPSPPSAPKLPPRALSFGGGLRPAPSRGTAGPPVQAKLPPPPRALTAPKKLKDAGSGSSGAGGSLMRGSTKNLFGFGGGQKDGAAAGQQQPTTPGRLKRQPSAIPKGSAEKKAFAEMAVSVPKKAKFVPKSPSKMGAAAETVGNPLRPPMDNLMLIAWSVSFGCVGAACGAAGGMALFLDTAETLVALLGWIAACMLIVGVLEPLWIVSWATVLTMQANAEKARRELAQAAEAAGNKLGKK